jgi:plastocyanin
MIRRAGLLVALLMVLSTSSASAATATVKMVNYAFVPSEQTVALGNSVAWHNSSTRRHTATPNVAWYWASRTVRPGRTSSAVTFTQAGTFAYHCAGHPARMKGTIVVPMTVSPSGGTTGTFFTLTLGTVTTPGVLIHDVQVRQNGGTWVLRAATAAPSISIFFPQAGTWDIHTRLRYLLGGSTNGWSPVVTVQVN